MRWSTGFICNTPKLHCPSWGCSITSHIQHQSLYSPNVLDFPGFWSDSSLNHLIKHEMPGVFSHLTNCLFWKVLFSPQNKRCAQPMQSCFVEAQIHLCKLPNYHSAFKDWKTQKKKKKECPILNWITSTSPFHQYSLNFPLWIPAGERIIPYQRPYIKIFNLSCRLLGLSEKGTQNNHSNRNNSKLWT